MDIEPIEKALREYQAKNGQGPQTIRLNKRFYEELGASPHAFLFDFVDASLSRERFMGMNVEIVDQGADFEIPEGGSSDE